jgi:hypothetical protein
MESVTTNRYITGRMITGCASISSNNAVRPSSRTAPGFLIDGHLIPSKDDAVTAGTASSARLLVGGSVGGDVVLDGEHFSDGSESVHGLMKRMKVRTNFKGLAEWVCSRVNLLMSFVSFSLSFYRQAFGESNFPQNGT